MTAGPTVSIANVMFVAAWVELPARSVPEITTVRTVFGLLVRIVRSSDHTVALTWVITTEVTELKPTLPPPIVIRGDVGVADIDSLNVAVIVSVPAFTGFSLYVSATAGCAVSTVPDWVASAAACVLPATSTWPPSPTR